MNDIPVGDARDITRELSTRLLTLFDIFRSAYPSKLKYVFKPENHLNNVAQRIIPNVLQKDELERADLDHIFDGSNRAEIVHSNEKLILLRNYAQDIAEATYTDSDSSICQLAKNLRSIIGQKAAEMNLLASLLTRTSQELRTYYGRIFDNKGGFEVLSVADITEAAEAVRRSRLIYVAHLDAVDYENSFDRGDKRLRKIFSPATTAHLTKELKAQIFTLQYVRNRKSEAKSVKQFLKKNSTFKAFATDLSGILDQLYTLGVLKIEVRENRSKRNANGEVIVRRKRYFATSYNENNPEHRTFLVNFQCVYPGQIFT